MQECGEYVELWPLRDLIASKRTLSANDIVHACDEEFDQYDVDKGCYGEIDLVFRHSEYTTGLSCIHTSDRCDCYNDRKFPLRTELTVTSNAEDDDEPEDRHADIQLLLDRGFVLDDYRYSTFSGATR